jgi:NhaA family Na+:H+ antiporter
MNPSEGNLPHEMIHRITDPLARFLKIQTAAAAILLFATLIAVALTNSPWSESFLRFWEIEIGVHFGPLSITRSIRHWINDGLMTLFFFVVALELKRELVLGELRNLRMALLPFAGALGGMLFPALFYLAFMHGDPAIHGWGVVMATDTAFVIGCLTLLGAQIPPSLRLFLLSLAIFDDIGAILVVAFGYADKLNWVALVLGFIGFLVVALAGRIGTRSVPVYSFLGILIWLCFDASGVHPTLVGVILGLMTPTYSWVSDMRLRSILDKVLSYPAGDHWSGDTMDRHDLRQAGTAAREALSPVERLEIRLLPWVGFVIMPAFALANAGVEISFKALMQPASLAIFLGLVFGKPIGVFLVSWFAVRCGFATLFSNLNWPLIASGSLLTGIGFTMSLFIAGLAFTPMMLAEAKIGILASSIVAAAAGISTLKLLTSVKPKRKVSFREFTALR